MECKVCGVQLYSCSFCGMCRREDNPERVVCGFCPDCVLLYLNSGEWSDGIVFDLEELLK